MHLFQRNCKFCSGIFLRCTAYKVNGFLLVFGLLSKAVLPFVYPVQICCGFQFVRFFSLAANETSVYPVHCSSGALGPSMTVRDMIKMMEKEKRTVLPVDSVDVVTTAGHIVEPNEPVANYAQSCVRVAFISISRTTVDGMNRFDGHLYACLSGQLEK